MIRPNPKPCIKKRKAISYIFRTNASIMSDIAKKSAPAIPTGLVEYLFNKVLVSKPAKNILLCRIYAEKVTKRNNILSINI